LLSKLGDGRILIMLTAVVKAFQKILEKV